MRITTTPGTAAIDMAVSQPLRLLEADPQPLRQVERVRIHAVTAQMAIATMVVSVLNLLSVHLVLTATTAGLERL